jgi:hypothetical protein
MEKERELSRKEVAKIISEIKGVRTAKTVNVTSRGALFVRPIDIIASDSNSDIINPPTEHTNGNGQSAPQDCVIRRPNS